MDIYHLKEIDPYIELNNLLKIMSFVSSGGEAKTRIKQGEVLVNGEIELRVRKKLVAGDSVILDDQECQISKG